MKAAFSGATRDIRHTLRALKRAPVFLTAAVGSLALGVGSAGAVLAVLDSVVLEALPYPNAGRLVDIHSAVPGLGYERWEVAQDQFFHLARNVNSLESVAGYRLGEATLNDGSSAHRLPTVSITTSGLELLGVVAAEGRLFTPEEDVPEGRPVAVLSYEYWMRGFGGDPTLVGRSVVVDGRATEVVGIAAAGIDVLDRRVDIWLPLRLNPDGPPSDAHNILSIGRLADGASIEVLQRELDDGTQEFPELFPAVYARAWMTEARFRTVAIPLMDSVVSAESKRLLWTVMSAAVLLLIIALANVWNLVLVRTELRSQQFALRRALGGTGPQLLRLQLIESAAITMLGGGLGAGLAVAGVTYLRTADTGALPRLDTLRIDGTVLAWAALSAMAITALLAVAPAMFSRGERGRAIMSHGSRRTSGPVSTKLRGGLVVAQVALALTLLAVSGGVTKSAWVLSRVDPGFDAEGVVAVDVPLARNGYPDQDAVNTFFNTLLGRVSSLPGVSAAGATTSLPLDGEAPCWSLSRESDVSAGRDPAPCIASFMATPGFFETLRVPRREGRWTTAVDNDLRSGAAVVTGSLADQLWPGRTALDRGVSIHGHRSPWFRVVGVTGDLRMGQLQGAPISAVFFPMTSPEGARRGIFSMYSMSLVVRAEQVPPLSLLEPIRGVLRQIDPNVPLANPRLVKDVVRSAQADTTLLMTLLLLAAAGGAFLGAVGLYGLLSYLVVIRTSEIGVRLAVGADRLAIVRWIVRSSAMLVLPGIALGVAGAYVAAPFVDGLLFGVTTGDPLVLSGVAVLFLAVALLATLLPAIRATRIEPRTALQTSA